MNVSFYKKTWKALLCWSKTCLPWTFLYLPFRGILSIIQADLEKSIWAFGELIHLRSYTRLPDGNLLLFRPFTWDHEAIKDVYGYEEYERVFSVKEGDVVVDVGAHIGTFSVKAAKKVCKRGTVIAVEPQEENYFFLTANKNINSLKNLIPVCGALSDHEGKALLYSRRGHSGGFSIVEKHSSNCIQVPVLTLDTLMAKHCLHRIDFMKIDAEGSELAVLKGGQQILHDSDANIVVAAYHRDDNPTEIVVFLQSLGYKTVMSKDNFIYAWKKCS